MATAAALAAAPIAGAETPIQYVFEFPQPQHRWMAVRVTFPDLGDRPLEARFSRSSPGRYALHDFVKNVFEVRAVDGAGRQLAVERSDLHGWTIADHDGTVVVSYKVYGDRLDGTFLAIDSIHAHINMPAALMWGRGLDSRPATLRFVPPVGSNWRVATQLFATADPLIWEAPNFQYLMDSPVELSDFSLATFVLSTTVDDEGRESGAAATFRISLHHQGGSFELEQFARDVEKIAREQRAVFGQLPPFDGGSYTFIADYLPWAFGDGMEHRNSSVLTSSGSLANEEQRGSLLGTASHELFHVWNVERIRPASLEPFDFDAVNASSELWLAEGFTSYYGSLILHRAGLSDLESFSRTLAGWINRVTLSPGREFRSVEAMSRLAPFVDDASSLDRTNRGNTFISYYTWGAALGLALDLELRVRSVGELGLDDYMRALWQHFGVPGGEPVGTVAVPYTSADAQALLAELSVDPRFADDFFARFIAGREIPDYRALLATAGFELRRRNPGQAWLGAPSIDFTDGVGRVSSPTRAGTPLYRSGIAQDDEIVSLGGVRLSSSAALDDVERTHRPGDEIEISFRHRGVLIESSVQLVEDPELEVVARESIGEPPSAAEMALRAGWLNSRTGNHSH